VTKDLPGLKKKKKKDGANQLEIKVTKEISGW